MDNTQSNLRVLACQSDYMWDAYTRSLTRHSLALFEAKEREWSEMHAVLWRGAQG